jgi:hypothetical protein
MGNIPAHSMLLDGVQNPAGRKKLYSRPRDIQPLLDTQAGVSSATC